MQPVYLLLLMMASYGAIAQPYDKGTLSFSGAPELLFTEQSLSGSHRMGFGASVKAEYVFAKHAATTFSTGFNFLPARSGFQDIQVIPVKPGIRYYLGSFYAGGEAGLAVFAGKQSGSAFVWSLGLGDKFHLRRHVFDIGLRHESWVRNNQSQSVLALRVGYEWARQQR